MTQETQGQTAPMLGTLRLLSTTDLHCNLLSYDYYSDQKNPAVGLSRVASLIKVARAEVANAAGVSVLLDNGDSLQGAPIGEIDTAEPGVPHPMMQAFAALGYDALGLGNHDFNFGLDVLRDVLADAPCPVLCSNMQALDPQVTLPFLSKCILERQIPGLDTLPPLRIGVLSVLPPQTLIWDSHHLAGRVSVQDMVKAADQAAADLKLHGCDVVVALAHTGVGSREPVPDMENALLPIAASRDIDAVIGGHTHLTLPNPDVEFNKPVVMPGAYGSHLGVIDLSMAFTEEGWEIAGAQTALRPIFERDSRGTLLELCAEDEELRRALSDAHEVTRHKMERPVGHSEIPLHSHYVFFAQDQGLALAAAAQAAAVRPFIAGTADADLPLLSAVSPGKFGGRSGPAHYTDIPAGDLCLRNLANLQVFPNMLRLIRVSGAELKDWLEMSAGLFNQISSGSTGQELVNPARAGHNFDVIFGLEYELDLSQPPRFSSSGVRINPDAHRVRSLRYQGRQVASGQSFLVATNSYRVSGGGNFRMLLGKPQVTFPNCPIRDVICDYAAGALPVDPLRDQAYPWRIAPLQGARVMAYCGPNGQAYLDELPAGMALDLGIGAGGYRALELTL